MQSEVQIGTQPYRIRPMRGRLFFDGREVDAICHHDSRKIEVADAGGLARAVEATARAVADCWRDACGVPPLPVERVN